MDVDEKPVSVPEGTAAEVAAPAPAAVGPDGDGAARNGGAAPAAGIAEPAPSVAKQEAAAPPPPRPQLASKEDDDQGEDAAEHVDQKPVPLLERPAQTSGRRERKTVERFVQQAREESKRGSRVLEEGTGEKLGDCPVICHNIATGRPDDVRVLHQIIFSRPGRPYEFRRNLRMFRGFAFGADSPSFAKKKENLEKYRLDVLRSLSRILDLDRKSGTREELALGILQFLCDPKPSGRLVTKKRRRKSKGSAKKAGKKSDAGDDEDASGEESGSEEDGEDKASKDEGSTKKAKKTPVKKSPAKKTPGKVGVKKPSAKKTVQKKRKTPDAGPKVSDSSSEDDEPLQKKPKLSKPPTDNDIKALVRKLLDGVNLEEVTMKNILTKVYGTYPQHDLTDRKGFIKATVKSLIS